MFGLGFQLFSNNANLKAHSAVPRSTLARSPTFLWRAGAALDHAFFTYSPVLKNARGFERAQAGTLPKKQLPKSTAPQGGATAFFCGCVFCSFFLCRFPTFG